MHNEQQSRALSSVEKLCLAIRMSALFNCFRLPWKLAKAAGHKGSQVRSGLGRLWQGRALETPPGWDALVASKAEARPQKRYRTRPLAETIAMKAVEFHRKCVPRLAGGRIRKAAWLRTLAAVDDRSKILKKTMLHEAGRTLSRAM